MIDRQAGRQIAGTETPQRKCQTRGCLLLLPRGTVRTVAATTAATVAATAATVAATAAAIAATAVATATAIAAAVAASVLLLRQTDVQHAAAVGPGLAIVPAGG